jgi:lysophospholipase L1-like esterase
VKVQELRTQMRATFKHMTLLDLERAFAKRGVGTDVASTEANRTVGTEVTGATTNVTGVPTAADRTQFFLDGVHPTATTYDLLGKYAAPILKKWARR